MKRCTRIGVISDTHGSLEAWERAWPLWGNPGLVIHAGDVLYHGPRNPLPAGYAPDRLAEAINACPVPVLIARGNCDSSVDGMVLRWPLESRQVTLWWDNRLIFVEHGDEFPAFRERALKCGADLAISGHTHVASVVREGNTLFINPGSAGLAKGRDPESAVLLDEEGLSLFSLDGEELYREHW